LLTPYLLQIVSLVHPLLTYLYAFYKFCHSVRRLYCGTSSQSHDTPNTNRHKDPLETRFGKYRINRFHSKLSHLVQGNTYCQNRRGDRLCWCSKPFCQRLVELKTPQNHSQGSS